MDKSGGIIAFYLCYLPFFVFCCSPGGAVGGRDEQKPNRKSKPHQKPQKPGETVPRKPHRYFGFGFGFKIF